jgi:hypothetical protein
MQLVTASNIVLFLVLAIGNLVRLSAIFRQNRVRSGGSDQDDVSIWRAWVAFDLGGAGSISWVILLVPQGGFPLMLTLLLIVGAYEIGITWTATGHLHGSLVSVGSVRLRDPVTMSLVLLYAALPLIWATSRIVNGNQDQIVSGVFALIFIVGGGVLHLVARIYKSRSNPA